MTPRWDGVTDAEVIARSLAFSTFTPALVLTHFVFVFSLYRIAIALTMSQFSREAKRVDHITLSFFRASMGLQEEHQEEQGHTVTLWRQRTYLVSVPSRTLRGSSFD